jgi:hypothetical protein
LNSAILAAAMGLKSVLAGLTAVIPLAECHYTFTRLRHNGEWMEPYRYIR